MRITPDYLKYSAPFFVPAGSVTAWFAGLDYELLLNDIPVWQGSGIKRFSFAADHPCRLAVAADGVVLYKLPRKEIPVSYGFPSFTTVEPARARVAPEILLMMENQRRNSVKREEYLLQQIERLRDKK